MFVVSWDKHSVTVPSWQEALPQMMDRAGATAVYCPTSKDAAQAASLPKTDFNCSDFPDQYFTDGCCKNQGKKKPSVAGYGVCALFQNHRTLPLVFGGKVDGEQTNQRAELFAIFQVTQHLRRLKITDAQVHTDSQYSIDCCLKYPHKWKKNGWMTAKGHPAKHRDLIQPMFEFFQKYKNVKLVKVKAHSQVVPNEAADWAANLAADRSR